MKLQKMRLQIWLALLILTPFMHAEAASPVRLFPGYVSQIRCEGRLILSSVGNDMIVRLEALPKDLGCGVLLSPTAMGGRTNLVLETSTGSIFRVLEIQGPGLHPGAADLKESLKGDPS